MLAVLAFSFLHFGALAVRDALLAHAVWLLPIGLILAVVFIPGAGTALLAFARSTVGRIVIACVLAGICGWEMRAYVDGVATLRKEAQASAAAADLDRRRLETLRHQVAAANRLETEANDRAATNEAAIVNYQQREADYEASLDRASADLDHAHHRRPGRPSGACALTAADIGSLRHAADAFGRPAAARRP